MANHGQGFAALAGRSQTALGRDAGPPAIRRSDHASGCPTDGLQSSRGLALAAGDIRRTRLSRGGDPDTANRAWRGGGASLSYAPERVRPGHVVAHCDRVVLE